MEQAVPRRNDTRIIIHFVRFLGAWHSLVNSGVPDSPAGLRSVLGRTERASCPDTEMLIKRLYNQDCFYAAVFEREDPKLKFLPLAVQQKQIIVTCNYEARKRGLYKLQLVKEARKKCPDVIIVLGENLERFRNAYVISSNDRKESCQRLDPVLGLK